MKDIKAVIAELGKLPYPFQVKTTQHTYDFGDGEPEFTLIIRNDRGHRAIESLNQLAITEAYMRDDIDFDGDFVKVMSMETLVPDRAPWIKLWRRLKPFLIGRERCNPAWIAEHYDSNNMQLHAADKKWNTYTPGLYDSEDDSLEVTAARKLQFAYDSLRLTPGKTLLEIGCGWGGFLRFCAHNGVQATGITLSWDQHAYVQKKIEEEKLNAEVHYYDFFTYEPSSAVDAISIMGVIEDLSDYPRVLSRVQHWIKPGGRIYLDFATSTTPFSTAAFITKYIWPGTFRKVYLPQLIDAISKSPFEIVGLYNDRRNYWLWTLKVTQRWEERKDTIVAETSEATWRMFRVLSAATAHVMSHPSHESSAMRMVLELPGEEPVRG